MASDSSSSGGSDSEEDDKAAAVAPAAAVASETASAHGNKKADLKRFDMAVSYFDEKIPLLPWPVHSPVLHENMVSLYINIYIWNIITTLR